MAGIVYRWACPECGRWIADADVSETTVVDPDAWYGVDVTLTGKCSRCGDVEGVDHRPVRWPAEAGA